MMAVYLSYPSHKSYPSYQEKNEAKTNTVK